MTTMEKIIIAIGFMLMILFYLLYLKLMKNQTRQTRLREITGN